MAFYCGNPICKKPVEIVLNGVTPWPTRCKGCGLSLYPEDILEGARRDELEMRPGVLMWDKEGQRVAVQSSDLKKRSEAAHEVSVDDVLAMVELPGQEQTPVRQGMTSARMWLIAVGVVVLLVIVAVLLSR